MAVVEEGDDWIRTWFFQDRKAHKIETSKASLISACFTYDELSMDIPREIRDDMEEEMAKEWAYITEEAMWKWVPAYRGAERRVQLETGAIVSTIVTKPLEDMPEVVKEWFEMNKFVTSHHGLDIIWQYNPGNESVTRRIVDGEETLSLKKFTEIEDCMPEEVKLWL